MTLINEQFYSGRKIFIAILISALFSGFTVFFLLNNTVKTEKNKIVKSSQLMQEKINNLQAQLKEKNKKNKNKESIDILENYRFVNKKNIKSEKSFFVSLKNGKIIYLNKKTEEKLKKNKEIIISFYSPSVPKSTDLIFLSSHVSGTPTSTYNKIYTYDLKNGKLNTIYREQKYRVLRTLGLYSNKLILLSDNKLNRDYKCFSPWSENNKFLSLNISDLSIPLEAFQAPFEKKEEARKNQLNCI